MFIEPSPLINHGGGKQTLGNCLIRIDNFQLMDAIRKQACISRNSLIGPLRSRNFFPVNIQPAGISEEIAIDLQRTAVRSRIDDNRCFFRELCLSVQIHPSSGAAQLRQILVIVDRREKLRLTLERRLFPLLHRHIRCFRLPLGNDAQARSHAGSCHRGAADRLIGAGICFIRGSCNVIKVQLHRAVTALCSRRIRIGDSKLQQKILLPAVFPLIDSVNLTGICRVLQIVHLRIRRLFCRNGVIVSYLFDKLIKIHIQLRPLCRGHTHRHCYADPWCQSLICDFSGGQYIVVAQVNRRRMKSPIRILSLTQHPGQTGHNVAVITQAGFHGSLADCLPLFDRNRNPQRVFCRIHVRHPDGLLLRLVFPQHGSRNRPARIIVVSCL